MNREQPSEKTFLRVRAINVGQGSCILLEIPGSKPRYGLIDCCYEPLRHNRPPVLSFMSRSNGSLDFVVITHPEDDHMLGISQVLDFAQENYGRPFEKFYESPASCLFAEAMKNLASKHSSLLQHELSRVSDILNKVDYDRWELWDSSRPITKISEGLWCEPLAPLYDARKVYKPFNKWSRKWKSNKKRRIAIDYNKVSLALQLTFSPSENHKKIPTGGVHILICGDVDSETWITLQKANKLKPNHLIIVPHHGGCGNPSELWESVTFKEKGDTHALISCGTYLDKKTKAYDHPFMSTLLLIVKANASIHCTNIGCRCCSKTVKNNIEIQRDRINKSIQQKFFDANPITEKYARDVLGDPRNQYYEDLTCTGDISVRLYEDGTFWWEPEAIDCVWAQYVWPRVCASHTGKKRY